MSYVVLHADRLASVATDDPIVPAAELTPLRDAVALLAEATRLNGAAEQAAAMARDAGYQEGWEAGAREAREAGEQEWRGKLFSLELKAAEDRRAARGEIARLALEVVRRIAGAVGEPAFLAGLAEQAAAELAPGTPAVVRVSPGALPAVKARLDRLAGLTIESDPALGPLDCTVETALGSTRAGLEVQLAQLENAWAEAAHGS